MGIESLFKPYLIKKSSYKGGKGKADVSSQSNVDKIYKLSSNENALGSSPAALEAIRKALPELFYYPDRTDKKLTLALEKFHKSKIPASQFLCANSAMEIIDKICRGFLREGDNAIACTPAFRAYKLFTGQSGAQLVNVPLISPDYRLDIDGIINAVNEKTRLVFLNSPNNPTGTIISRSELKELLDRLPPNVITVYDEVYFHFNQNPDFCMADEWINSYNIIGINSLSKCFGLAGLRVGYMYSNKQIIDYLAGMQRPFQLSSLVIEGAIAAVNDTEFMAQTVELVNSQKPKLYRELDNLGVTYWKSQANFIMIKPEMDEFEFENKMIEHGVMVRPVGGFGAEGCVRVTIGTEEANEAYINALTKVIKGN